VSPEAWAQLPVPLAYAWLLYARGWKHRCRTYEGATRRVFKGHTEVVHIVTRESVPEILEDPTVKHAGHWVLSASVLYYFRSACASVVGVRYGPYGSPI